MEDIIMKNILDEMQKNKLLKIHESSLWVIFFVLNFVIVVQYIMGANFKEILGELIVLFFLSMSIVIKCVRLGIWTSEYAPSHKKNFLISAIVSVAIVLLMQIRIGRLDMVIFYNNIPKIIVLISIIYIICFLALTLAGWICFKIYTKNENYEDEEI